jgi:RNA polymerase sigma factor (sigma-70 family)
LVLRVLAAIGGILLAVVWGIPLIGVAAILGLVVGASFFRNRVPGHFSEAMFASVAFVVLAFAAFVVGAFVLRLILNLASRPARSALKWLVVSWVLAAPVVIWISSVAVPHVGAGLGTALWLVFAFAIFGGGLAFAAVRALWRAGQRSTSGAAAVATAALLLVVLPVAALSGLPTFVERVKRLRDTQPSVHELFAYASTPPLGVDAGAPRSLEIEAASEGSNSGESAARVCYAQLAGKPCDDVWHRTQQVLGTRNPATNDALHAAYLYVCIQKTYAPPRLCGAFRVKAERLKIDAWRYTRRFLNQPDYTEPACATPSAEEQALTQEEINVLDHALGCLGERSRRIVHLAYWEDLTDPAIGIQMRLSAVRVRVLRREAERELAEFLKRCP